MVADAKDKTSIYLRLDFDSIPKMGDTLKIDYASYDISRLEEAKFPFYKDIKYGKICFSRFDIINKIISGTFQFQAQSVDHDDNPYGDSNIDVTDGRFDLELTICPTCWY